MLRAGYFLGRDSVEEMNASVPLVRVVAPPAPLLAAGDILDFGQALGADEDHIALARCQVAVALLRLALLAVLLDGLGDSPTGYENEGSSDNKGSTDSQVINCGVNLRVASGPFRKPTPSFPAGNAVSGVQRSMRMLFWRSLFEIRADDSGADDAVPRPGG